MLPITKYTKMKGDKLKINVLESEARATHRNICITF